MKNLLDDETLEGAHEGRISYRPQRVAVPISRAEPASFAEAVRYECQIWGGATTPIIPVEPDGSIDALYRRLLPGAALDRIHGHDASGHGAEDHMRIDLRIPRSEYGSQLAVALLQHKKQSAYRSLEIVELELGDPWRNIYAACLGLLPDRPDSKLLDAGRLRRELAFEDFLTVERLAVSGSLADLIERVNSKDRMSPRSLSMIELAYGNTGSSGMRTENRVLPEPKFAQYDAGPNVIVVCSPDSIDDLALLWNLRGAHGDFRTLPIGVPAAQANRDVILQLANDPWISRNGFPARAVYVTSASLSEAQLVELLGEPDGTEFGIASAQDMLTFGHPGSWVRDEVLVWKEGRSRFVPLPAESHRLLFQERGFGELTRMHVDLEVLDNPFPNADDIRLDAPNAAFYAGRQSSWGTARKRSDVREMMWPSKLLMAKSVARKRKLDLRESEPGRAARIALSSLGDIGFLGYLIHAPLLDMLEGMAARQGFGWYKQRLRGQGNEPQPIDAVGPTTDELPEKSFSDFKRALGNSEKATKFWLLWAEKSSLIIKGFQLQCPICQAKQWIPVAAFTPPIVCRGCAEDMDTPFGDRPNIDFRYRISERLRRVYENDAMGHLLVAYYFHSLFSGVQTSALIGLHPGMEVRTVGSDATEGEADVLLFTRDAEFVPAEVKRTSTGFSGNELTKLDHLCRTLNSPWSAVATCQYGRDVGEEFPTLAKRAPNSEHLRITLSYDAILDPQPSWALGGDPFEWNPLTEEQIQQRESEFVRRLAAQASNGPFDWLSMSMLGER